MPSFLSKVFGRKKDEKASPQFPGRGSGGSLLDGKFEAVSPTVSPSVANFPENALKGNGKEKDKEKDGAFNLFKVRSRPSSPEAPQKKKDDLPRLSLVLPVSNEGSQAVLGVAFEACPNAQISTGAAIDNRRLNPSEALILVRTCSQAIIARGLETLGLMHPHWYSASPDAQRRLISLFIHSLNTKNAIAAPSPSLSLPSSIFESEVNYTRSPHDVAAVLRWGLRHLELDGGSFGKEGSWYKNFAESERNSEYPPKAYSEKFTPLVPQAHLELLNATLDLFSSLASHAENNGTSGSRLTKTFGFWLLTAPRVGDDDDWSTFYARWQRNGRMLEHLFLARIRDEALRVRMPTRLTELVTQYPYLKGSSIEDDIFLHPRLSTRQFGALFVRVETEFSSSQDKVRRHPLQFIKDAFVADVTVEGNDYSSIWEKLRKEETQQNGGLPGCLSRVFADETIRYLTLVPGDHPLKDTSPAFSITEISHEAPASRRRVSSPGESSRKPANGTSNGHAKPATDPTPLPSATASPLDTDWSLFSSTGFSDVSPSAVPLASTLFGQDVEKTNPPFRKPSRLSRVPSPTRSPRKSVDVGLPRISNVSQSEPPAQSETPKLVSKAIPLSLIQIDEAFIEFWVDALLDPISSNWPTFVLCKLKSSLPDLTIGDKRIEYLVLEQVFIRKPQPTPAPAETAAEIAEPVSTPEKTTASSPKSSVKSEKRFFGFFTSSSRNNSQSSGEVSGTTSKGKKKVSPQARVNELGEILKEDDEKPSATVKLRVPSPKLRKSVDASRKSVEARRKSADVTHAAGKDTGGVVESAEKKAEEEPVDDAAVAAVAVGAVAAGAVAAVVSAEDAQPTVSSDADVLKTTEDTDKIAEGSQVTAVPVVLTETAPEVEKTEEPTDAVVTSAVIEQQDTPIEQPAIIGEPVQEPFMSIPVENVPAIDEATVEQLSPIAEEPATEATATKEPVAVAQEAVPAPSELPAPSEEPIHEPVVAEAATLAAKGEMAGATAQVEELAKAEEPVLATEGPAPVVEEPIIEERPPVEEPVVMEQSLNVEEYTSAGEPATVEEATVEEPVVPEDPVVEDPSVGEHKATEEPVRETPVWEETAVEEPVVADEPVNAKPTFEEPEVAEVITPAVEGGTVKEPAEVEEAVVATEEPAPVVEEPSTVEEPPVIEEPAVPEQPSNLEGPTSVEESTKVEEAVSAEELVTQQHVADLSVEESTVEEPSAAVEPTTVKELAQETLAAEEAAVTELTAAEEPAIVAEPTADEPSLTDEIALEESNAEAPALELTGELDTTEEPDAAEVPEVAVVEPVSELGIEQEQPIRHQVVESTSDSAPTVEETPIYEETSTAVQEEAADKVPEPETAPAIVDEELVPEGQVVEEASTHGSESPPEPVPETTVTSDSTNQAEDSSIQVVTAAPVAEPTPAELVTEGTAVEPAPEPEVADNDDPNDTTAPTSVTGTTEPMSEATELSEDITTSQVADTTADEGKDRVSEPTTAAQSVEPVTNSEATSALETANGNGHSAPAHEKDDIVDHEIPSTDANHTEPTSTQVFSESIHSESAPEATSTAVKDN